MSGNINAYYLIDMCFSLSACSKAIMKPLLHGRILLPVNSSHSLILKLLLISLPSAMHLSIESKST